MGDDSSNGKYNFHSSSATSRKRHSGEAIKEKKEHDDRDCSDVHVEDSSSEK